MSATLTELQDIFRQVFGDDSIELAESTTADEVEDWDSMMHINLIIAIEKRFKIKFAAAEIAALKGDDQNVGSLVRLIDKKTAGTAART